MTPSDYTLILCFGLAFIILGLALGIAIMALIEVRALQKSTHNIQYVPLEENDDTVEFNTPTPEEDDGVRTNTKKKLTPEQRIEINDDHFLFGEAEGLD